MKWKHIYVCREIWRKRRSKWSMGWYLKWKNTKCEENTNSAETWTARWNRVVPYCCLQAQVSHNKVEIFLPIQLKRAKCVYDLSALALVINQSYCTGSFVYSTLWNEEVIFATPPALRRAPTNNSVNAIYWNTNTRTHSYRQARW